MLEQIAAFRQELHDEMAEGLDHKSLQTLVKSLQRMRVNLNKRKTANRPKVRAS